jgi:tetratricopeptide (TPR) repeat protein
VPRRLSPAALALATLLAAGAARADDPPVSWATAQAIQRTRLGRDHAAQGEPEAAVRSYLDAIGFDATYGPAYLALGDLQAAQGDVGEAERAFSMGIDHVAGFTDALLARAKLRARLHRGAEAIGDLEAAAALRPEAAGVLRALTDAYIAARALPAALAVTRRRLALAEAQGDARDAGEARAEARALAGLVGEVDPVTAGSRGRGAVRRALWAAAWQR